MVGDVHALAKASHSKIPHILFGVMHSFISRQINFSRRLDGGNKGINVVVDATECRIDRPQDNATQKEYYSGKDKCHTIKYELGIDIVRGFIVWLYGGVPGHVHDLEMSRASGIFDRLLPGELLLADKGYIGVDLYLTPMRQPVEASQWFVNSFLSKIRVLVENVIGRVKVFSCLRQPWRNDLSLHPIVMDVLCNLINLEFESAPPRS